MKVLCFTNKHKKILIDAAIIAEEVVSNYFRFSSKEWKKMPYDIKTTEELNKEEMIPEEVFAQVLFYTISWEKKRRGSDCYQFYRICLNDHLILNEMKKQMILLLPFLVYILTHELVHIVRFSKFYHLPHITKNKELEEKKVCKITFDILSSLKLNGIKEIIKLFTPKDFLIKENYLKVNNLNNWQKYEIESGYLGQRRFNHADL